MLRALSGVEALSRCQALAWLHWVSLRSWLERLTGTARSCRQTGASSLAWGMARPGRQVRLSDVTRLTNRTGLLTGHAEVPARC